MATHTQAERIAFVRAICKEPGEDAHRLVFADWLEEAGDWERSSFIRVQVGLSSQWDGRPLRALNAAKDRECDLFVRNGADWFGPTACITPPNYREISSGGEFRVVRRGFVEEVRCTLADFEAHAAALFAAQPITAVFLTGVRPFNLNDDPAYPFVFGFNKGAVTGEGSQWLPEAVYDLLQGAAAGDEVVANGRIRVKAYTSAALAADALSAALVTHGRQLARLDVPCGACGGEGAIERRGWTHSDASDCDRCKGTGWVLNTGE
jgi:uncharacterized protein (TIGR02996 family)